MISTKILATFYLHSIFDRESSFPEAAPTALMVYRLLFCLFVFGVERCVTAKLEI